MRPTTRRTTPFRMLLAAGLAAAVAAVALDLPDQLTQPDQVALVAATNPATPGNFTGYGFDQCVAPKQASMDAWLNHSPFLAVGIYISGNSRACRSQPNLTPTWVSTQLRNGWRLLPITLGPQASCSTRYPKYGDDPKISADSTNWYAKAKAQGKLEAERAVTAAKSLGIVPGSTLWYDLEAFDIANTHCRESAIRFVHAWTVRLHELGYVSGYYSSAGSGIKMIDDARVNHPGVFTLPDYLWVARWDGVANTTTESRYLRTDGWQPHRRVKQYQGGHNETWGGVTINIDRNYLDVGRGSIAAAESHCGGVPVDFSSYATLKPGMRSSQVTALKCLLKEQGYGGTRIDSYYGAGLRVEVQRWQAAKGFLQNSTWSRAHWVSLHSQGHRPVMKFGSAGSQVRRLQRALVANGASTLRITGVFDTATDAAFKAWQARVGLTKSGVVNATSWGLLGKGR